MSASLYATCIDWRIAKASGPISWPGSQYLSMKAFAQFMRQQELCCRVHPSGLQMCLLLKNPSFSDGRFAEGGGFGGYGGGGFGGHPVFLF